MNDIKKELDRCARCGKCRAVCPTFIVTGDEARVARGRITLFEAIIEGRIPPTAYGREILMSCYGCMRCAEACPSGVRIDLIIREARLKLAREMGIGRIARLIFRWILPSRRRYDALVRLMRLFQKPLARSGSQPLRHLPLFYDGKRFIPPLSRRPAIRSLPELVKGNGRIKVSFFAGCMLNYIYPEVAASIMRILSLHGVDIVFPRDQLCCGTPVMAYGDIEAARTLAERNVKCLEPEKVDAVVVGCASCGLTMKRDYPFLAKRGELFSERVYDISEFIDRFLGYSNLPTDEKVTYHDPCHLRWGRGIGEQPRRILRQSCRFIEMERSGQCCGLGGSFSLTHYDVSCALGELKVDAVVASGAGIVATSCPGCILQIQDQLARRGIDIPVVHVAQIYEKGYLHGRMPPSDRTQMQNDNLKVHSFRP